MHHFHYQSDSGGPMIFKQPDGSWIWHRFVWFIGWLPKKLSERLHQSQFLFVMDSRNSSFVADTTNNNGGNNGANNDVNN